MASTAPTGHPGGQPKALYDKIFDDHVVSLTLAFGLEFGGAV